MGKKVNKKQDKAKAKKQNLTNNNLVVDDVLTNLLDLCCF